ncbi:ATP-binding cassette domain-containing protein [Methylobacterium organophilum]|nr:ATP-binding cassette domain-containing protein [Methylobacterium organophilum]
MSLAVTGPERVALCGRNGSGKSTLLAVVAGRPAARRARTDRFRRR